MRARSLREKKRRTLLRLWRTTAVPMPKRERMAILILAGQHHIHVSLEFPCTLTVAVTPYSCAWALGGQCFEPDLLFGRVLSAHRVLCRGLS